MNEAETIFRVLFVAILVLNIGVSGSFRKKAREAEAIPRSAETPDVKAVRAALALPGLAVMLLYVAVPGTLDWASLSLPDGVRWGGVVLGLVVLAGIYRVFSSLGSNVSETVLTKESHELVTIGPYRRVRHPLYTVGVALILALALIADSGLLAAFALLNAIVFRTFIVPREEANLVDRFGDDYVRYRRTTGALLPKWKGGGTQSV